MTRALCSWERRLASRARQFTKTSCTSSKPHHKSLVIRPKVARFTPTAMSDAITPAPARRRWQHPRGTDVTAQAHTDPAPAATQPDRVTDTAATRAQLRPRTGAAPPNRRTAAADKLNGYRDFLFGTLRSLANF